MLFIGIMFVLGIVAVALSGLIVLNFHDIELKHLAILLGGLILSISGFAWFQTHRIIPVQQVGVVQNSITQELSGSFPAGLVSKPFFGKVYHFPASSSYERCEQYTPAIKGSYGIILDLCFYYDTANVDWVNEIQETGSLEVGKIWSVWRNSIVGDVAESVKEYTPEALSANRAEVELAIYNNIKDWYVERGIPLVSISLKNWDFASEQVATQFDESIVSQRRITEQTALLEAAQVSRQREEYEAETARIVAELQRKSLEELGFEGDVAIQYLWIKAMVEAGQMPDVIILGTSDVPVAIPVE